MEAIERALPMLGDAGQLHQVIINLVVNAAHAIGDAMGTITVALAADEAPLAPQRAHVSRRILGETGGISPLVSVRAHYSKASALNIDKLGGLVV